MTFKPSSRVSKTANDTWQEQIEFMLKKIKLKNFMSHKSSEFDLVKGINVITGPNNSGKSAVISALQLLADLPVKEGDYMVRHGTSLSSVTVETGEGDELSWQRKGSVMSLMINEDKDMRLQNNREHYLEKVHKYLKLPKVSSNEAKQDFDIHFATQKNPIFLINEPPSRAALFFASSSDAGRLFEVRDKYKDLVKAKKKEKQNCKIELEQQNKILERLAPLDCVEELFKFVQEVYKLFPKEQEALRKGDALLNEFKKYADKFNSYASKHQLVQKLIPPPQLENSQKLEVHRKVLKEGLGRSFTLAEKHTAFAGLAQSPALVSVVDITINLQELRQAISDRHRLERTRAVLVLTKVRPVIENTENLAVLLKSMQELNVKIAKLNSQQILLDGVSYPPELEQEATFSLFLRGFRASSIHEHTLKARMGNLLQLSKVPDVENLPQLEKTYVKLSSLNSELLVTDRAHFALSALLAPPHMSNTSQFETLFANLKIIIKLHAIYLERTQLGCLINTLPEFEDVAPLEKHLKDLKLQAVSVQKLALQFQEAECVLQQWVNEHPACPSCGGNLNIEKLQASICNGQ